MLRRKKWASAVRRYRGQAKEGSPPRSHENESDKKMRIIKRTHKIASLTSTKCRPQDSSSGEYLRVIEKTGGKKFFSKRRMCFAAAVGTIKLLIILLSIPL